MKYAQNPEGVIGEDADLVSRRRWIKRYMLGSVTAPAWAATLLMEVAEAAQPGPARLRLNIADYTALQSVGGSVQLQFSDIYKPLTINRVTSNEFATLDSVCTHSGCTVGKFIAANGYMRCPCHGSRYNARGHVVQGPAPANLNAFTTTYDALADMIEVAVPDLGLNVNSISVQSRTGNVTRLKLVFQVTAFATYEVRYQNQLGGTYIVVPFALTAGGTANQSTLVPNDDGERTVYVDAEGDRGFFVLGLQLTSV